MNQVRFGYVTAPVIGALWMFTIATTVAVAMSFATGTGFRPSLSLSLLFGALLGAACLPGALGPVPKHRFRAAGAAGVVALISLLGFGPIVTGPGVSAFSALVGAALTAGFAALGLVKILDECRWESLTRHEFEAAVIRFLTGFGYIFFTAIVLIPFYVMVMTSLKNQAELIQNPLDFSVDLSKGWDLFRSY
ncbi:MAG: carbohydrate ABC transporter permease, partial [Pseudomonadota bacterium]